MKYTVTDAVLQNADEPDFLTNVREFYKNDTLSGGSEVEILRWSRVHTPFIAASWLIMASIARTAFAHMKPLMKIVPESALLIFLGVVVGCFLQLFEVDPSTYSLDSEIFFIYLLPPIIFDAGYTMPNRALFENFDSVGLFALVGTIWNTLAIGFSLYGISVLGAFETDFSLTEIFLFAALIAAVDPESSLFIVAVIAVFEEIHVNEFLFINVFGEALFNDAISVVLYQMFVRFEAKGGSPELTDLPIAALSFSAIALGGVAIGIVFALITGFATKLSTNVKTLGPVFIFVVPYMAYLFAEMTSTSSLLAITFCGMVMKPYVKASIPPSTAEDVKKFIKILALASESVVFMFLGLSAVVHLSRNFDAYFISVTLLLTLLFRITENSVKKSLGREPMGTLSMSYTLSGVLVQCALLNRCRRKKFSMADQLVLSFSGLHGAIAFGLVVSMDETVSARPMFVSATIVVIIFNVFVQGIAIRPLLKWLKIKTNEERHHGMMESVSCKYLNYTMSALEHIAGQKGTYSYIDRFERFNARFLMPLLTRSRTREELDAAAILSAHARIIEKEAMLTVSPRNAPMADGKNDSKI